MPPVCYTAPVVCPMNAPPLADGGVVVDAGLIRAVGPAASVRPHAARTHAVDGVLVPGLVNAATRFEHADLRADPAQRPDRWDDDRWRRSAHRGVQEALRAGVTAAGDVVRHGAGVPSACRAGLAGDSFLDVPAGARADAVVPALERALDQPAPGRRTGIAAPPAVDRSAFDAGLVTALAELAARRRVPLRLRAPTPVAALDRCGALTAGATVEVGRALAPADARLIAERGATVVCAPGPATGDAVAALAAAVPGIALGTGDGDPPDVLVAARLWSACARRHGIRTWPTADGPVPVDEHAVRLATVDGAAAGGWDAGVLAAGRRADLVGVAIDTTPATVYADLVLRGAGRQLLTVVGGVRKARRAGADRPWPPVDRTPR